MNNTTRTFKATYARTLDGATLSNHSHEITVSGYGAAITFQIDGNPATLEQAEAIRLNALSSGTFTRTSGPTLEVVSIGKKRGQAMHIELARKGYPTNHYDLASGVLGREVASLAALTEPEARTVWTALIYGAGVAA
jgi:hypothetical protein